MYDLTEIKSISCEEVARNHGLHLKQKGSHYWLKLRPEEKTSSCRINTEKNLWYDFGSGRGGSVIDLVMEISGLTKEDAINYLAEEYGFEKEIKTGWRPLTDTQYRSLGIQPEKATMNFGFDLNKHSVEQLERWSSLYNMHVKDLAEKYPSVYNKMVIKIGLEGINVLRDAYEARLESYHDSNYNEDTRAFLKSMSQDDANEISRRVDLLQRAVKGISKSFSHLKVDFEKDFDDLNLHRSTASMSKEDSLIKDRIVKVYKKLFNLDFEHLSVEQAKALQEINNTMVNGANKYIPIDGILKTYELVGQKIDSLERQHASLLREGEVMPKDNVSEISDWSSRLEVVEKDLLRLKDLFNKCDMVCTGIKDLNHQMIQDKAKQNGIDRSIHNDMELSH